MVAALLGEGQESPLLIPVVLLFYLVVDLMFAYLLFLSGMRRLLARVRVIYHASDKTCKDTAASLQSYQFAKYSKT